MKTDKLIEACERAMVYLEHQTQEETCIDTPEDIMGAIEDGLYDVGVVTIWTQGPYPQSVRFEKAEGYDAS